MTEGGCLFFGFPCFVFCDLCLLQVLEQYVIEDVYTPIRIISIAMHEVQTLILLKVF